MTETSRGPEVGIHVGVDFEEYRSWEAINWHTLWRLYEECPAKAKYEMQNGMKETEALAFGKLTDFILLEPGRFAEEAVVEPEIGEGKAPKRPTQRQLDAKKPSPETVAAIEFWQQWDSAYSDKIVVTRADYDRVIEIEAHVRRVQCREFICGGRSQVCIVWRDDKTGLLCKGRLDYEKSIGFNHVITDLKTARSAKQAQWQWAIFRYGYDGQLAWYHDGWLTVTGETSLCNWIVSEKDDLCIVKPYEMDDLTMAAGRKLYRGALDQWAECVEKNDWPDYGGIEVIGLNDWQLRQRGVGPDVIEPVEQSAVQYRIEQDADTFEEAYKLE